MKRSLHSLLFFFITMGVCQSQILNNSFEEWYATTEYEQPIDMRTSNANNFIAGETPNVTKVNGLDGFAARVIGVRLFGILTFPGVVGTEELLTDGIEKVPYTGMPDGVEAVVRHNVQPGDTSKIVFGFFKQGTLINSGTMELTGIQDQFVQVDLDFPDFSEAPDEIYWAILSSGIDIPNADSWIEVDHINFTGGAPQLANNGFNAWEERGWEDPVNWFSTNKFTSTIYNIDGVSKTSDAHHGNWAMRMESSTDDEFMAINISGIFLTDYPEVFNDNSSREYSIATEGNNTLRGWYKYTPNGNLDHAAVGVLHNDPDAPFDAEVLELLPAEEWTKFELVFPGGADSIIIQAAAGLDEQIENFTNVGGSVLLLDHLSLDMTVASEYLTTLAADIKYLSQSHTVQLSFDPTYPVAQFELFDMQGRKIAQQDVSNQNHIEIPLAPLVQGVYLIRIKTNEAMGSKKIFVPGH